MQRSKVVKGVEVKYDGFNRSYLKTYPKAQLTGEYSSSNASALVEFLDDKGTVKDTAWVGLDYIQEVKYVHADTIKDLQDKKDALLAQVAGFDAAIAALKALG